VGSSVGLGGMEHVTFESYGVRVRVSADTREVLDQIPSMLPPGAEPCPIGTEHESFGLLADADGSWRFTRGDSPVSKGLDLDFGLMMLSNQVRLYVAVEAPNLIFVHAGVVAYAGRGIVIPGLSFAGKTTLVAALVRAGAVYYSDEYAAIDENGLVHAYARPLSIRDGDQNRHDHHVEQLGGMAGEEPIKIRAAIFTEYRPGAEWRPEHVSLGRAVLAMLRNTVPALKRSEEAIGVFRSALDGAVLLEGDRGEADATAKAVVEAVAH
jgi:hypothetical protein